MIMQMSPESAPARVLVVDDDPIFAGLAAQCLVRAGFDVRTAGDGVDGLEWLDAERFDLAIVDLLMPRIDGLRLIALVRGSERLQSLAILVVSARNDAEAYREAMAIGADATQSKPVDWSLLPERARAVIADRRAALAARGAGT